mgnify:CR=1 FL=1
MGHRAIHPNLCLASRNTYSRSTLGDLEKITEQLEWWAPLLFFLVSYRTLAQLTYFRFERAVLAQNGSYE